MVMSNLQDVCPVECLYLIKFHATGLYRKLIFIFFFYFFFWTCTNFSWTCHYFVLWRKFSDLCGDTDKNKKDTFLSKAQFAPDIALGFQILVLLRKICISCNNQCQFSSICFHSLNFSKHYV